MSFDLVFFKIFIKSYFIGLGAACAVGPIFLLVLQRALRDGFFAGFLTGIGVALADGILFSMGFAGVLSVANWSPLFVRVLLFVISAVLISFGLWSLFFSSGDDDEKLERADSMVRGHSSHAFAWMAISAFLLNVTNPVILVFFTSVASRFFPELVGKPICLSSTAAAAIGVSVGSLTAFAFVSAFAFTLSFILIARVRRILEVSMALAFIFTGCLLVLKNLTFSFF